ncbi:MAG: zinc-binding dehydrogenase, partial [Caulobacteraceae bacterium]|nr:zinc-binding dehydrogenase [Caulobacteraceae bacterium]
GSSLPTDPDAPVVFGHEFCAEVLDSGSANGGKFKPGARVVGLPYVTGPQGADYVGYSNRFPGGLAEQMVLTERLLFEVPNGLSAQHAAMTEPFAVGAHAVARAAIAEPAVIAVVGCGPIGLAVIAALKARGLGPVVGLDFSPGRRGFAEALGADEVVDPRAEPLEAVWARHGAGKRGRRAVAFECIGRPAALQSIVEAMPTGSLVIGVGNSLEASAIDQVIAFNKELDIRFSLNYTPAEFRHTLEDIAEGRVLADKVLTSVVAPEAAPSAFEALKDPERQAKIVVSFE